MSEAVEILIKADDKASDTMATASTNMVNSMKKVERILGGLEEPADRYARQLEEIKELHASGAMSAEQFAVAHAAISDKLKKSDRAIKETGENTKKATEFFAVLAQMSGSSELQSLVGTVGNISEKVGQFSEVSKTGGAGALAFKLGLVGLAATGGAMLGKALGDWIFQTKKFERELERTKQAADDLNERVQSLQSRMRSDARADIELIRDPEKKKAAYQDLLASLNRDVQTATGNVNASQKAVEEWAEKWKITGDRTEFEKQAQEQLKIDQERLKGVREERDEILRLVGAREAERQAIIAKNQAEEASEKFLENLRLEIEMLSATKEKHLELEAARNTTSENRGEAERLLRERDAILAKLEAEKEAAAEQKRLKEERQRAAEREQEEAEAHRKSVQDLIAKEKERLKIREIELTQGKEAARIQALMNEGVSADEAKKIAAKEAELNALQEQKNAEEKKLNRKEAVPLQAAESRLLTRGSGNPHLEKQTRLMEQMGNAMQRVAKHNEDQLEASRQIAANTARNTNLVMV
jgi:uncharacterized protein YoaH (UPF0181 family)